MSSNLLEIFFIEQQVLENSNQVLNNSELTFEELRNNYSNLRDEYSALLNQVVKLTRLSDSNQRKIIKTQDKLEELNATKDKFFSVISHDLRNPITSVLLSSNLLMNVISGLSQEQIEEQINKITNSIKTLYDLFENLNSWSQTQTGRIEFKPNDFDICESINSVINLLKNQAENKNILLETNCSNSLILNADKSMIDTILRNIISNSIKFTKDNGYVKILTESLDNFYQIKIIDNGVGISKDKIDKLFKIGEKSVSTSGTNKEKGTGLGLILCKEFIDYHKGEIIVNSEINLGTEFIINIPYRKN